MDKDYGSRNAVGIKIPVDADFLTGKQRLVNPGYGLVHIREQERVTGEAPVAGEEGLEFLWPGDTAVIEKLHYQWGKAGVIDQLLVRYGRQQIPSAVAQAYAPVYFRKIKTELCPPNPKELVRAVVTLALRATLGT